jgi:hypothetical protein
MPDLEYHKGHLCICQPILCQEGFCQDCMIHREQILQAKLLTQKYLATDSSKRKKSAVYA